MATPVFRPCPNPQCVRGAITTMEAAPVFGSKIRSTAHMAPMNRQCGTCKGAGRVKIRPEPAASEVVTYGGTVVNAPGFSQDQFERAMVRAFCDDLQVKIYNGGRYLVHHAGLTSGYVVSRERCTCKAGQAGTPCKHRAALIAHLDIREPYVAKQWAKLNAERPVGRAVA